MSPAAWSVLLIFCFTVPVLAQRSKLDCPRPVRERRQAGAPGMRLEIAAGMARPLLYRNGGEGLGGVYRFRSRTTPFAAVQGFFPVSEGVDAFAGVSLTQTWQGLRYRYEDRSTRVEVTSYTGSLVLGIPLGFRIRAGERLSVDAGGYLSYAAHSGQEEESSNNTGSPFYTYSAPDHKRLNFGLRFAADFRISGRFGAAAIWSADALHAAPATSRANPGITPATAAAARLEPYLMQVAVGLRYTLVARDRQEGAW